MPGPFKFNLVKHRNRSSSTPDLFSQGGTGCTYWWTFRPACGDLEGFYDQCKDWAPMKWNPFADESPDSLKTQDSGIFIIEDFQISPKANRKG